MLLRRLLRRMLRRLLIQLRQKHLRCLLRVLRVLCVLRLPMPVL